MGSVVGRITEEQPKYEVRTTLEGEYEVRVYAPNIAIETPQSGSSPKEKDSAPFMTLAGYIGVRSTPQNKRQEPVSMTSPVVCIKNTEAASNGDTGSTGKMQFILPSSLADPPEPVEGSNVTVVKRSEKIMAVRTFTGNWDEHHFEKERDKLLALLERDGIETVKPMYWETYRYNPPWTLSNMRTNEVAIQLVE